MLAIVNTIFLIFGIFKFVLYMEEYYRNCEKESQNSCPLSRIVFTLGVLEIVLELILTIMAFIFSFRGIKAQRLKSV